jgi:hypothetical protein
MRPVHKPRERVIAAVRTRLPEFKSISSQRHGASRPRVLEIARQLLV